MNRNHLWPQYHDEAESLRPVSTCNAFRIVFIGAVLVSGLAAGLLIMQIGEGGSIGDSWAYNIYAKRFREHGFLYDMGSIRTYGYPAFLYFISFLPNAMENLPLYAGAIQYILFGSLIIYLYVLLGRHDARLAVAVALGLLLNIFLLSIVVDALTEGLSVVLGLLLLVLILTVHASKRASVVVICLFLGALASSFSLMVRPANFTLLAGWNVAAVVALFFKSDREARVLGGRLPRLLLLFLVCTIAACAISWTPQIAYNLVYWNELTIFPVCRLGPIQVLYGIAMLRYDTVVLDNGSAGQFFYINPFATDEVINGHPIEWYIAHPMNGLLTILARTFLSFDVDHLFTYVGQGNLSYRHATRFIYWMLLILGLGSITGAIRSTAARRKICNYNGVAGLTYVAIVCICVLVINFFSAVELRFSIYTISALTVLGVHWLVHPHPHKWVLLTIAITVALGLAGLGEHLHTRLGSRIPSRIYPQVQLPPSQCYTFASEVEAQRPQYREQAP